VAGRTIALLVEAHEPGALNLCRAFREAGHHVAIWNRGPRRAEGDPEVRDLGRPSAVVDVYPLPRWRDERRSYLLNSLGHKAARLGFGSVARKPLLAAFDKDLAAPVQERLAALAREHDPDVVVGFWGIGSLPEQRALQRAKVGVPLVHQFQTYPLGKALQAQPKPASPIEQEVLGRLDGRLHATPEMEHYLDAALRPVRGVDQILPEAWGPWASAGRQRKPLLRDADGQPHVVHMGVPPQRPGAHDDVGPQLDAIASEGIAVHAVEGFDGPRIKAFPRMGLRALLTGEVATFMTQFDALVLPVHAPPGLQWFAGNMPARFLSAIAAGIPVAVPRGIFGAVQRMVEREGNGFVYDAPSQLATWLRDPAALAKARNLAMALEREWRLDKFLPKYEAALDLVVDHAAGKGPAASATLK
jgi:hypothetical protein